MEVIEMSKSTITRTWLAGLVALAVGLVVAAFSIGLMLAYGGTFTNTDTPNGYQFVPHFDSFFWTTVGVMIAGFAVVAFGGIIQLVAWIGALINTFRLHDKTWFAVLLAGGVLSMAFGFVGFAVMVAYLVAGPDGMTVPQTQAPAPSGRPSTLVPTA
jgi:hypothetical protein